MANAFKLSDTAKNAILNQFTTTIGASPLIRIYDGTIPADANTALGSQVLLGTLTMAATPFGAASGGTITAGTITQDSAADATSTAVFYRLLNSAGTVCYAQGTVGVSGCDLNLTSTSIVTGGIISITSMTISI